MADLNGKIQTVLGCIKPEEAGITLVHEHLSMSFETQVKPPAFPNPKYEELAKRPVSSDIMWWITHNPYFCINNLRLLEEQDAMKKEMDYSCINNLRLLEEQDAVKKEMEFFKSNGGGTIVENSTLGLQRDVKFFVELAKTTNVNIVQGAGYYEEKSRPGTANASQEDMVAYMTKEIVEGCDGTSAKAGAIGEIGCSWPIRDSERRAVQASAQVECDLGVGVTIHPGRDHRAPSEVARIYMEAGGHADRLLMSHTDRTIFDLPTVLEFAKLGTYIDYDLFGIETSYYHSNDTVDMPSDAQRIAYIRELINEGHADRVTVGHDIHTKHRLMKYGGHGYSHILLHTQPRMKQRGISQENVDKILKENPQRWLTFNKHTS